jgi:hypothetical protein
MSSQTLQRKLAMQQVSPPDRSSFNPEADGETLRTTNATRQLLSAIATDASRLAPRLRLSRRLIGALIKTSTLGAVLLTLVAALALLWSLSQVPLQERPGFDGASVIVEAANGQPLGRVGSLSNAVQRRDFPDLLVKAVLSIEDRRFFSHWGVDPWGILRAAYANWKADAVVEGGSSITQQLVKLQFVGNERSLTRKVREAMMAAWLDLRLGKDEILTRYLNSGYLGAGAYGMAATAHLYFDKQLRDLTLPEAAMLAGLIRAPSRYDPTRNLDAARRRADVVLDAMQDGGAIDGDTAAVHLSCFEMLLPQQSFTLGMSSGDDLLELQIRFIPDLLGVELGLCRSAKVLVVRFQESNPGWDRLAQLRRSGRMRD